MGSTRVVVVGAGIVGATTAWQLARRGADVVLVEAGETGPATSAGAGIVQPFRPATDGSWGAYSDLAARRWPDLAAELADDAGQDPSYATVGGLTLGADAAALQAMADALRAGRSPRGWGTLGDVELLGPGEAARQFPGLRTDLPAVWTAGTGRVDGRLFRDAALAAAERAGAVRRSGRAELSTAGDGVRGVRVQGIRVDGDEVGADVVVAAAGAWTAQLCRPLGLELAVGPMRGQIVHFGVADEHTAARPTVMTLGDEFGHHYVLGFPGGRVVVGATREACAGFDPRVTAAGQRQVLDAALALVPGLADATVLETRVGFRPVTPDGLPLFGALPGVDGLVVATGLGANGLTYGPLMGELAAGLALGVPAPFDLAPFGPARRQPSTGSPSSSRTAGATPSSSSTSAAEPTISGSGVPTASGSLSS